MQLEIGKLYITRKGDIVKIVGYTGPENNYPWAGDNRVEYTHSGRALATSETPEDIVIEAPIQEIFIKADANKNMLSLIEPQFIISLGEIMTFGATKYSIDNWKLCEDPRRYKDALLRHTYAYLGGELIDPESGIQHTACMAFNTMALQWFDNNTPS